MKIAVTGGFGFVGRNLVNRLLTDNHEVVVLSYARSDLSVYNGVVKLIHGSIDNRTSLEAAFNNCDIVIHLVGIIAETKSKTFIQTVIEGTKNIVLASQAVSVKKIIYVSALGTNSQAKSKYHQSKYKAEQIITESGIQYLIIRPSLIYGEGDGFVSMLKKMITYSPVLPVIGDGKYKMQPVYIDDLTEVIAKSISQPAVKNKIIDVAGPEKLEYLEILYILKSVLNKKRMNLFLPVLLMKFIASVMEKIVKPAPLTTDQIIMMEAGNTGDIEEMIRIFEINPVKFEDGLRKYLR